LIFVDTNVVSETFKPDPSKQVIEWLTNHDASIALPSVVLAELSYGIERIRPDQRAARLEKGLTAWQERFRDRIYPFHDTDALAYGKLMGKVARSGRPMSMPDGMIAAMALARGWALATRNIKDFKPTGIDLVDPWQ